MPNLRFQLGVDVNRTPAPSDRAFLVHNGNVVLYASSSDDWIPRHAEVIEAVSTARSVTFIGTLEDQPVFAIGDFADEPGIDDRFAYVPLRQSWSMLGEEDWAIASRAAQVVEWDRNHRYCGRCGTETDLLGQELGRRCSECGLVAIPAHFASHDHAD